MSIEFVSNIGRTVTVDELNAALLALDPDLIVLDHTGHPITMAALVDELTAVGSLELVDWGGRSISMQEALDDGVVVSNPVAAFLDVVFSGANNDLHFEAVTAGAAGNAITVAIGRGAGGRATTDVTSVAGTDITITTSTDGGGVVSATANDVVAAIVASGPASALVTCTASEGDGSGLITNTKNPLTQTPLAGGSD